MRAPIVFLTASTHRSGLCNMSNESSSNRRTRPEDSTIYETRHDSVHRCTTTKSSKDPSALPTTKEPRNDARRYALIRILHLQGPYRVYHPGISTPTPHCLKPRSPSPIVRHRSVPKTQSKVQRREKGRDHISMRNCADATRQSRPGKAVTPS